MKRERATKKQQELLQFVDGFIREHGYGPSYREVMNALQYKSVSTVAVHINGLVAKGYLHRRDASPRSLEVVTKQQLDEESAGVVEIRTAIERYKNQDNAQAVETLTQALSLL